MKSDQLIHPLEIQKYVNLSRRSDLISFAAGMPDVSVLPTEAIKQAYHHILTAEAKEFQYQPTSELLKLKIQKIMTDMSVSCSPDELLITYGAQQAISLTAQYFFERNAPLMVEEFVYPGFLQNVKYFNLECLKLPLHTNHQIDLDSLEILLKSGRPLPFLYVICNGHNPLAITMDVKTREGLAYLAEKYNFILVEDDPYRFLSYTDHEYLPLRAYTKNAVYIGSFSKIIAPSLRVGWMVGDQAIISKLVHLKDMNDLSSSNPNHIALNSVLDTVSLPDLCQSQSAYYKRKLNCMVNALNENLETEFQLQIPEHGLFLWLELPRVDLERNKDIILEESKVLTIPASAFATQPDSSQNALRLGFSFPSFEDIDKGLTQLCRVLNAVSR